MNLSAGVGMKTSTWFPNQGLRNDDINYIGKATYQNFVDEWSVRLNRDWASSGNAAVIGGLNVVHDNLLTVTLQVGSAISSEGTYFSTDTWGYSPAVDSFYAVIVSQDTQIGFVAGGAFDRYDVIEIRPVENFYNAVTREFKDPVTGIVATAVVDSRIEYGWEFAVRKGNDTAPGSVPANKTPGWIKIAEVAVVAGATTITGSNIVTFVNSTDWIAEAGTTILSPMKLGPLEVHGDADFTGALQKDGSDVVNLASNQTITGDKTLSGANTHSGISTFSTQIRVPTTLPTNLGNGAIWVE